MREQLRGEYDKEVMLEEFPGQVAELKKPGVLFKEIQSRAIAELNGDEEQEEHIEEVQSYHGTGECLGVSFGDEVQEDAIRRAGWLDDDFYENEKPETFKHGFDGYIEEAGKGEGEG